MATEYHTHNVIVVRGGKSRLYCRPTVASWYRMRRVMEQAVRFPMAGRYWNRWPEMFRPGVVHYVPEEV